MINLKRTGAAVAAVAATAALSALCACGNGGVVKVENDYGSDNYVLTVSGSVMQLADDTTLYDYLCALKEDGEINFEAEQGDYGMYITSVEGIAQTNEGTNGYSWMIYTDLTELDGVTYSSADYGTWGYDGKTLNSASYGVSGLPAVEGYTYALVYSYWSY